MPNRSILTLPLLIPLLCLAACGGGSDDMSPEAERLLERMREGLEKGFFIGWEDGIVKLRERGEARHAVPLLLELIRSDKGDGLRASSCLSLVRALGPQGRAIAGPLAAEIARKQGFFWKPDEVVGAIAYVRPQARALVGPARELLGNASEDLRCAGAKLAELMGPAGRELVPDLLRAFDAGKSRDRSAAADALAAVGGDTVVDELAARVRGGKEKGAYALQGLRALGSEAEGALEVLVGALQDPELAGQAAECLVAFPDAFEDVFPSLARAIRKTPADDRWKLVSTVGQLAPNGHGAARDLLLSVLEDTPAHAARGLVRVAPADAEVAARMLAVARTAKSVRNQVVDALGELEGPSPDIASFLAEMVKHHYVEMRVSALVALAKRADQVPAEIVKAAEALVDAFPSNEREAAAAATLLIRAERFDAADTLLAPCVKEWRSRGLAFDAIQRAGRVGPATQQALVSLLSAEHFGPNADAAELFGDLGRRDPTVERALEVGAKMDHDPRYRVACARALARIRGDRDQARDIALAILASEPTGHGVRTHCLRLLLTRSADPHARAALETALEDASPGIRALARQPRS